MESNVINITIDMIICFLETGYKIMWIPDKEFSYGSFPSEEDSKKLLHILKYVDAENRRGNGIGDIQI
ncbi:hypothetical protein ACIXN8_06125 [Bacteroides fragilis]